MTISTNHNLGREGILLKKIGCQSRRSICRPSSLERRMFGNLRGGLGRVMTLDTSHRRRAFQVAILGGVVEVTEGYGAQLRFGREYVHLLWFASVCWSGSGRA